MATKLRVLPLDQAHECPFYVMNTKNKHVCVWKQITTPTAVVAMTEDNPQYDSDVWQNDCGGSYDACAFIPLFYQFTETSPALPQPEVVYATSGIDDYDPFDRSLEEDQPEPEIEQPSPVVKAKKETTKEQVESPPPHKTSPETVITCRVSAHLISDPYQIQTDIFIRPTNALLAVDDPLLLQRSNFNVQFECDKIIAAHERAGKHILMGQVYVTSNGGDHPDGVVAKAIYHAVVLSPSRVINEVDIHKAIYRGLMRADVAGAKVVTMQPFDCGTLELGQGARVQMASIYSFLKANPETSIKNIFIVMDDQPSVDMFHRAHKLIFKQ